MPIPSYERVFKHPGMVRLVSHDALLAVLTAVAKRSDEWVWECLAETIHRAWLLGGGNAFEHLEHFENAWIGHGFHPAVAAAIKDWCSMQQKERCFILPSEWKTDDHPKTREKLALLLSSWENADGMVVFVFKAHDPDINDATALPFIIGPQASRNESDLNGLDLSPAIELASHLAASFGWMKEGWRPSLHFSTLTGSCDIPLGGLSACLPILAALRFRSKGRRLPPLQTAFSGVLDVNGQLDPIDEPHSWEKKRRLIRQIGSRGILPGDWPVNEPVTAALNDMLTEMRSKCKPAPRIPVPPRAEPRKYSFDSYLNEKRTGFVGREWLLDKIEGWRFHDERAFLIEGEPGLGKSSVVAQLINLNPDGLVIAHHCCQADVAETLHPGRFVQSIAAMLADRLPEYDDCLTEPQVMAALSGEDAASALSQGIIEPLGRIKAPKDGVRYVVIDALDEAVLHEGKFNIVDMLSAQVERFPSWLRIVATTRNDSEVLNRFSAPFRIKLDAADSRNIDDIAVYIRKRIRGTPELAEKLVESHESADKIISTLSERSDGNFLYAVQALDGVQRDHCSFKQIKELPPGLEGLYLKYFERVFRGTREVGFESRYGAAHALLQVMVAAREPLTSGELAAASGLDAEEELPKWLRRLRQFLRLRLRDGEETIALYHKSVADWLRSNKHDFHISEKKGRRCLADYCAAAEDNFDSLPGYVRRNGIAHFTEVEDWDRATAWLTDLNFIAARARAGDVGGLLADYNLVLDSDPAGEVGRKRECEMHSELQRWDRELLNYTLQATKRRASSVSDDTRTIPLPRPPKVVGRQTEEERQRRSDNPSQLEKLRAFKGFVAQNADALSRFAEHKGFVLQTALNSAPSGPMHDAAIARSEAFPESKRAPMLIRDWQDHDKYNPTPGCLLVIKTSSLPANEVCISPDGRRVISGHGMGILQAWDVQSGDPLFKTKKLIQGGPVTVTLCNRDVWALHSNGSLSIWNPDNKKHTVRPAPIVAPWRPRAMSVVPDGMLVLIGAHEEDNRRDSGDWKGGLFLWDRERNSVHHLAGNDQGVSAVDVTPDGRIGISIGSSGSLHVWDLEKKVLSCPPLPGHTARATCLSITPDGRWAISGGCDRTVRLWDLDRRKWVRIFDGHSHAVTCVCITPDGSRAVSGSADGALCLWDLKREKPLQVFKGHLGTITDLCMTADGRRAVSCGPDRTLRIWDLEAGVSEYRQELFEEKKVAVQLPCQWDSSSGLMKLRHPRGEQWSRVAASVMSPDRKRIMTAHDDTTLRVWNVNTAECLMVLREHEQQVFCRGHEWQVTSLAISPNGILAVSGSDDGTIRIWDLASGRCLHALVGHHEAVGCVAFSPDGRRLLSGSSCGTLQEWDTQTGKCRKVMEIPHEHLLPYEPENELDAMCAGPNAKAMPRFALASYTHNGKGAVVLDVVCSSRLRLTFWDLRSGRCLGTDSLAGDRSPPAQMWLSPDDSRIFMSDHFLGVSVWDLKSRVFLTGFDRLRDADTWDGSLDGFLAELEKVKDTCTAFTSDGSFAIVGDTNGKIRALDLETGQTLWEGKNTHLGSVNSVVLTPDDKFALSVGSGMNIAVWDIGSGECIQRLKFDVHPESLLIVDHASISFGGQRFRWKNCV